ncbi:hypothetical protein J2W14_002353 [Pseudarthrobacter oxydans]|uniref:hypothetical protein n=1 Tax=Pseudarthrobacter oxydans TaxID=1671 RepID=UPI00278703F9|nr:hypothetical protein [Pseudarthrobacter oxydans]MDP9982951.1 hypothetical protein [Pseudarthrobacter oxydans]
MTAVFAIRLDNEGMNDRNVQLVAETAWAVRQCVIALKNKDDYAGFRYFPGGACKWTSAILQRVLAEAGLGGWVHRHGNNFPDGDSHTWLELDGWFLDVTLDQFSGFERRAVYLERNLHPQTSIYPNQGVVETTWIDDSETLTRALNDVNRMLGDQRSPAQPSHHRAAAPAVPFVGGSSA